MIELILILCLIWNTLCLINRQTPYVSSGWENYEFKVMHSKPGDWSFHQLLIIPKVRSSPTSTNDFEKIESPNPHTDAEWPAHDDYDTYIKKKPHSSTPKAKEEN